MTFTPAEMVKMADAQIQKIFKKNAHIFIEIVVIVSLFHVQIKHVESKVHEATQKMIRSEYERAFLPLSTSKPLNNLVVSSTNKIMNKRTPVSSLVGAGFLSSFPATASHERDRVETWCKAYMNAYASAAARFVECAIRNARPLTFCENCVMDYEIIINLMKEIVNQDKVRPIDPDSIPGGSCMNSLLHSDMINIVGSTNDFINQLWKSSACDYCFDQHNLVNGMIEFVIANSTLEFESKYNATSNCIENFIETRVGGERNTTEYNHTACDVCSDLYRDLNDYYAELNHHGGICMDIVDTMNYTRNLWSKKFKCTLQQKDLAAVLTVTGMFCLLPIVFYSAAKLHSAKQHMKIIKQRRMSKPQSTRALRDPPRSPSDVSSSSQHTVILPSKNEQTDDEAQVRTRNENADDAAGGGPKEEAPASARPKVSFKTDIDA